MGKEYSRDAKKAEIKNQHNANDDDAFTRRAVRPSTGSGISHDRSQSAPMANKIIHSATKKKIMQFSFR
jgi:hypothetical protein